MFQHWHRNCSPYAVRGSQILLLAAYCVLRTAHPVDAAPKLPPAQLEGKVVEDLPAPYDLQPVVLNRTITLTWSWAPPDPGPVFDAFGYEVTRNGKVVAIVAQTTYTDRNLAVGSYTYKVRVKGSAKEAGKKIAHVSAFSEPAAGETKLACTGPPVIHLKVEPTKKIYGSIPALRLHFIGDVQVPEGCHANRVTFHIDSGLSTERSGPMSVDANGHFDEFIDALGPEDEGITGGASFAISVTAKDEAGGASSSVYTINLERENPYAPKTR